MQHCESEILGYQIIREKVNAYMGPASDDKER